MALFIVHRRHRLLILVVIVLGVAAWGSWLAATGRTTSYGDGAALPAGPLIATPAAAAPAGGAHGPVVPSTAAPSSPAPKTGMTTPSTVHDPAALPAVSLTGVTDPKVFAERIARLVFAYRPDTDFEARDAQVMAVAALPPLGDPTALASDLAKFTPDTATHTAAPTTPVSFRLDGASTSQWIATQAGRLHLPDGTFGVDVTGSQTITGPAGATEIPVLLGVLGVCPPATVQCEIDRIFPQAVQATVAR